MNAVNSLKESEKHFGKIWRIRYINYPIILIDVLSISEKPILTLSMNLENWDFLPPTVTLTTLDLKQNLGVDKIPEVYDDPQNPVKHIVFNQVTKRIWFCSPGFFEYHQFYPEDRWELIKNTEEGTIKWIVNRAVMLIDREKLDK